MQEQFNYLRDLRADKVTEYNAFIQTSAQLEQTLAQNDDVGSLLIHTLEEFHTHQNATNNLTKTCEKIVHSFSFADPWVW